MCPYYLDGDLRAAYAALGDTRVIGYCAVFKVREEAYAARESSGPRSSEQPAVRRSLKTQQHASRISEAEASSCGLPGPVDISSGRTRLRRAPRNSGELKATILPASGALCLKGLPRKEVIQPQLPLRLPCSRYSPCRHGARTISSSSSLEAKPGLEQTALPRVPGTDLPGEGLVVVSRNVKPPEIGISSTARVVDPATLDAFAH
jgi:hypothetical protein